MEALSHSDNLHQAMRDLNHDISVAHDLGGIILGTPNAHKDNDTVRRDYYDRLHQEMPDLWRLVVDMEGRRNIIVEMIRAKT